jgi:hypothetical protein
LGLTRTDLEANEVKLFSLLSRHPPLLRSEILSYDWVHHQMCLCESYHVGGPLPQPPKHNERSCFHHFSIFNKDVIVFIKIFYEANLKKTLNCNPEIGKALTLVKTFHFIGSIFVFNCLWIFI